MCFYFSDTSNFKEILQLAVRWDLAEIKLMVEEYLRKSHRFGLASYTGTLQLEQLNILQIADEFGLEKLVNSFIIDLKGIHFLVQQLKEHSSFEKMSKEVRFEIIKTIMKSHISENLVPIFEFFDFLIYEDRIIDHCPKRRFRVEQPEKHEQYSIYKELKMSDFNTKTFFTDLTIKVNDGTKLYVNSHLLSENSPVFAKRLKKIVPNEDEEKVMVLPWTNMDELMLFLTFLQKPRCIDRKC